MGALCTALGAICCRAAGMGVAEEEDEYILSFTILLLLEYDINAHMSKSTTTATMIHFPFVELNNAERPLDIFVYINGG
jgi:hypothetical protein